MWTCQEKKGKYDYFGKFPVKKIQTYYKQTPMSK